jgi:hypothetical protein
MSRDNPTPAPAQPFLYLGPNCPTLYYPSNSASRPAFLVHKKLLQPHKIITPVSPPLLTEPNRNNIIDCQPFSSDSGRKVPIKDRTNLSDHPEIPLIANQDKLSLPTNLCSPEPQQPVQFSAPDSQQRVQFSSTDPRQQVQLSPTDPRQQVKFSPDPRQQVQFSTPDPRQQVQFSPTDSRQQVQFSPRQQVQFSPTDPWQQVQFSPPDPRQQVQFSPPDPRQQVQFSYERQQRVQFSPTDSQQQVQFSPPLINCKEARLTSVQSSSNSEIHSNPCSSKDKTYYKYIIRNSYPSEALTSSRKLIRQVPCGDISPPSTLNHRNNPAYAKYRSKVAAELFTSSSRGKTDWGRRDSQSVKRFPVILENRRRLQVTRRKPNGTQNFRAQNRILQRFASNNPIVAVPSHPVTTRPPRLVKDGTTQTDWNLWPGEDFIFVATSRIVCASPPGRSEQELDSDL